MQTIPISPQGFIRLKLELEALKKERPVVLQAIREAREEGDVSKNTAYDTALERQTMLEKRIRHIESRMPHLHVVDPAMMGGEKAVFGATVMFENVETGERKEYTLLGPDEADYTSGSISVQSPVAKALLGRKAGDEVVVDAPKGRVEYEIVSVKFMHGGTAQ
ncbi:transcription elongation factor GreA [Desulfovibrio psychrotolerans]|uniref:Transcription elongation factor GreA n=1 Tax=Desulfovibrio psychrotolerans TaxID=415242 RepID=A0A7J0BPG7_9BACT|nr:transcription elongation factor GreA [Desulfovibrio psychrotolerans]GFM35539.1 transcription elongation factor GreA [Desulfovibrio psychrotolerans]